jgi:hypothetical protein
MSIQFKSDSDKRSYVKDAVLLMLHAARGCGATEDILRKMPLTGCGQSLCGAQFRRRLNGMQQNRLIALKGITFTIAPRGTQRLHAQGLI